MTNYPPYVNAYNLLTNLFEGIKTANVPTKFNRDFLSTMLGLKSSSYNAMIPLLKNLGFLDPTNTPTDDYRNFRDPSNSRQVLARRIKSAYGNLFSANAYAHRLTKQQVEAKLKIILGVGDDDKAVHNVAGTFRALCDLADFESEETPKIEDKKELPELYSSSKSKIQTKLGLNYTINLTLPATTDIEVFNAIFKSLREHILNE